MANFIPIDSNLISISNPSGQNLDIAPAITRLAVSFTMDMCSEINFDILDPGFKFANANYFQIRRDVIYSGMLFEISAVEVQRSSGYDPLYRISAEQTDSVNEARQRRGSIYWHDPNAVRGGYCCTIQYGILWPRDN